MDKGLHEREDLRIVGSRGQHEFAVTECILNRLCHIAAGKVVNHNLRAAFFF